MSSLHEACKLLTSKRAPHGLQRFNTFQMKSIVVINQLPSESTNAVIQHHISNSQYLHVETLQASNDEGWWLLIKLVEDLRPEIGWLSKCMIRRCLNDLEAIGSIAFHVLICWTPKWNPLSQVPIEYWIDYARVQERELRTQKSKLVTNCIRKEFCVNWNWSLNLKSRWDSELETCSAPSASWKPN